MSLLPQRRLRFIVIAVIFTIIFTYTLFGRNSNASTWRVPIPSSVPPRRPIPTKTVTPPNLSPPKAIEKPSPVKLSTTLPSLTPEKTQLPTIPEGVPSHDHPENSNHGQPKPPFKNPDLEIPLPETSSNPVLDCLRYETLQNQRQKPWSEGSRQFPYSRPSPECRTFNLPAMEKLIEKMKGVIRDPDLFRLFENAYPNTLDTMIKWRGYAKKVDEISGNETTTDEELTYVITGDIDAMWLRDSASQIYSYLPLLEVSSEYDSLASLWRGLINIHSRYIIISPYCHSFQPPPESGVFPTHNGAYSRNRPNPPYDPKLVFDCKWELDSLASFLQISSAYYQRTKDMSVFQKYNWVEAVGAAVKAAGAMRLGTYSKEGKVEQSAWTFTGWTNRGSETLTNDGLGNPTKENGMVRTAFRPSDDACIYQLLVPANMMFAKYLEEASLIMEKLTGETAKNLTISMRDFAFGIRKGIDQDAIVHHRDFGDIFAYEIDGYGGANLMDDANIPSLLVMPLWNYTESAFALPPPPQGEKPKDYAQIYSNTRRFVLSTSNPYFMKGPVISAVGGPHVGPGKAWPMAAIVRALTAFSPLSWRPPLSPEGVSSYGKDEDSKKETIQEIRGEIMMVLNSTAGTGVIHESVNSWSEHDWTRAWFGWANGLFGELIIRVSEESGALLKESWQ